LRISEREGVLFGCLFVFWKSQGNNIKRKITAAILMYLE